MPSNEARRNLLSNERLESFWDALWLELGPFLYFIVESRRIACRCLQTKRGAICYRMSVSTPSGTACGSSYGRFCILCAPPHVPLPMCPAVTKFPRYVPRPMCPSPCAPPNVPRGDQISPLCAPHHVPLHMCPEATKFPQNATLC